jgi:hypothetical protein
MRCRVYYGFEYRDKREMELERLEFIRVSFENEHSSFVDK